MYNQGGGASIQLWWLKEIPTVTSIARTDYSPTDAKNVQFITTFSVPVTGVDPSDFRLTTTGEPVRP
jgi:hypothetical protein